MITRLFIDNYRCFVNFEFKPESLCLLVGDNGVGKSSVLEVVELLRDFIGGHISIKAFNSDTLTRWQSLLLQSFTMEVRISERLYVYDLVIEHEPQRGQRRVIRETLILDGSPLYLAQLDNAQLKAQLFKDNYSKGPEVSFDWTRSGIGFLQAGPENTYLCEFREFVGHIMVVGYLNPDPRLMVAASDEESGAISRHGENFVSWYRAVALEHPAAVAELTLALRDILPGFSALALPESGDKRVLKAQFQPPDKSNKARYVSFAFNELSDGQRCLIILYALLHVYRVKPGVLLFDEPDNFIALREIQPWLALLEDICEETGVSAQVLIASHNPELINYLGTARARKLERPTGGAVRVAAFNAVEGLSPAETIARGWD